MIPVIRIVGPGDADEWMRMRVALWSDVSREELIAEIPAWLDGRDCVVFVAERVDGGLCGFLELAIRPCSVNGEIGRFGYIEGWYVDRDVRRESIGKSLVHAAETWTRQRGCIEIHSDAHTENLTSQFAHKAIGFEEIERLVHFRKRLMD